MLETRAEGGGGTKVLLVPPQRGEMSMRGLMRGNAQILIVQMVVFISYIASYKLQTARKPTHSLTLTPTDCPLVEVIISKPRS